MHKSILRKIVNIFSALAIISQSLTPYAVLLPQTASAQEVVTETPTPTPDQTTVTETPTPTPDQTTVTPTDTPTETATPTPTDIPTDTVTPTPDQTATPTDTQTVDNNSPPSTDSGLSGTDTSITPTTSPSVTIDPSQDGLTSTSATTENSTGDEQLSLVILDNVSAPSVDLGAVVESGSASLTTDKTDYAPTDTALITGSGLLPNTDYTLHIWSDDAPATSTTVTVTSDDTGKFAYAYQLDGVYRPNYSAELKDSAGNVVATVTFTDSQPLSVDANQCKNGGVGNPPESCAGTNWVTGNVNGQKAHWHEGEFLSYRAVIKNLDAGFGSYTFSFDVTKAGKHAIDYLGSFDATETTGAASGDHANLNDPCGDIAGLNSPCSPSSPTSTTLVPAATLSPFPTSCGSDTLVASQIAGSIKAWGLTGLSASYVSQNVVSGSDCTTTITVSWTGTSHASGTKDAVIAFGGHVASKTDWGIGNSATSISGSPYHVHQVSLSSNGTDKGVGSQDLQLSTSAIIVPATIDIIKNTVNGDGTFEYTTSGNGLSNFSITTLGGTGNPNKEFTNLSPSTAGGSRTITETIPSGWSLTGLSCISTLTDNQNNPLSSYTTNVGSGIVTVSNLAEGDTVTCTYTNTKQQGTIELQKEWSGTGGQTTLQIGTSAGGSQINSTQTGANGGTPLTTGTQTVNAGTYYISEAGGLTNYSSSLSCTKNGQSYSPGASDSVVVGNQDVVICKFTNTRKTGTVIVKKVMVGGTDTFTYTGTPNGSISSNNGTIQTTVDTGSYTSTEDSKSGWDLTSIVCNDTNSTGDINTRTATFNVESAETVTCTFTNTKRGTIIVKKHMVGDTGSFDFTGDVSGTINTNDGTLSTTNVLPGTYVATESAASGWTLDSIVCDDGRSQTPSSGNTGTRTATFNVGAGETVTCTFTNTKQPTLAVYKVCDPAGDLGKFNLQIDGVDRTSDTICGGWTNGYIQVSIGSHTVSETAGSGTNLTNYSSSIVCDGQSTDTVNLAAGENKSCTITNTRKPKLTIVKQLSPSNDPGLFNLSINGTEYATDVTNGGTTNAQFANIGSNTFSESAGTGTSLSDYTSVVSGTSCTGNATAGAITLAAGDNATCTITNTRQQGTLLVNKEVDTNGDDTYDVTDNATANGLGFAWGFDSTPSNNTNSFGTSEVLNTNSYDVYENNVTDYHFTGWYDNSNDGSCENPDDTSLPKNVNVNYNETTEITLCNQRNTGTLKVNKLVDRDGNGNYNDPNPQDFTWSLDGSGSFAWGLKNVVTGDHDISENSPSGYSFTGWFYGNPRENEFSCQEPEFTSALPAKVNVATNQLTEITLCNQAQNPVLTISKEVFNSDESPITDKAPGDAVMFKLTVTATQSAAYNVVLTDLPSEGFTYRSGTGVAESSVRGTLAGALAHAYASPGIWSLGNMVVGEIVTIKYLADISGGQATGTYYDNAWAYGCKTNTSCSVGDSNSVLANAINPGDLDTGDPTSSFVGTQVSIINGSKPGVDYKAGTTQEVLGAAILPATGEATIWVIIATLLGLSGFGTLAFGLKLRRKNVK